MSLAQWIAEAGELGLAVSGLACSDRCVPLLGGDDELLRPLWSSLTEDAGADEWGVRLRQVRERLAGHPAPAEDEAVRLARRMLATAPGEPSGAGLREWADACSAASLCVHRLLESAAAVADAEWADGLRAGRTDGVSPLVAAELRDQTTVLELLAAHGTAGLRPALAVTTEGRRVLRAVVSRRARGRG
ncbi:hypothetical protein [Streptomyces sp. NPDC005423]|uniref:hypothetical protein n=1 Tax=Streptomyces sp. NPDC005423 TaxID=3155343 RepID=UPI0033B53377